MPEELHDSPARVVSECLRSGTFIKRHDGPGTLFYLDPIYRAD